MSTYGITIFNFLKKTRKGELCMINEVIDEMYHKKEYAKLRDYLREMEPADVAELLTNAELEEDELIIMFRILPKELAADVFVEMEPDMQETLIKSFSDKELEEVMDQLYLDDTVDIIEEMPANVVRRILRHTDPELRRSINTVLHYPKASAGSIMTIEYVDLRKDMTVLDAFTRIRRVGIDKETIYTCYVIQPDRKLIGMVSVKTLLLSNYEDKIEDIMETNVIYTTTLEDQEEVADMFTKYDFIALPVVDSEERLVGIITVDDVMDVIEQEATEDIEKMAAIVPSEHPYMKSSTLELYKKRIVWLLFLMISATFTGLIITNFEEALTAYMLAAYIPMLMDTGGNAGSQASVSIIRGLSLDEIEFGDIFRIQGKEILVAAMCGVTLATANFVKLLVFDKVSVTIALVVCITLLLTVIVAKFVGCTLPILAKRIGFDPAVMASPFITTIVDAISLLIYFQIASHVLSI